MQDGFPFLHFYIPHYLFFYAMNDDRRILPGKPTEKCWNSHCSDFSMLSSSFTTNLEWPGMANQIAI